MPVKAGKSTGHSIATNLLTSSARVLNAGFPINSQEKSFGQLVLPKPVPPAKHRATE
jgi:hypothetical protein